MIARDAHSTDLISRQTKTVAIEKFWMTRSIERAHAHLARVQIAEEAFRQARRANNEKPSLRKLVQNTESGLGIGPSRMQRPQPRCSPKVSVIKLPRTLLQPSPC